MSQAIPPKTKHAWQEALVNLMTDPQELLEFLNLDPSLLAGAKAAIKDFPLKVTRSYAARMQKNNLQDPLLQQILPINAESNIVPGYESDPLREEKYNPVPGLLHKYHGRVLVTLTSACAVNCRFCFRRHFPYEDNNPGRQGWEKIIAYIAADVSITEVILSGGDPLAVSDTLLQSFCDALATVPHVKRLRFHTRFPIVLPERITDELIAVLTSTHLKPVMIIHCNHPQEINDEVRAALAKLGEANIALLNQTVLLKNINDDAQCLAHLSETLFSCGVTPYYLHVLDKVAGAAHFDLPLARACELQSALQQMLPGYLVPRLVREDHGKLAKTLIG